MSFSRRRRPGLLGTVARTAVVAGTAQATANAVNRQAHGRAVEQQQAAAFRAQQAAPATPPAAAPPVPPPTPGPPDLVSQLTGLGRLHDTGVLTAAEFEAAKAALLTR